MADHEALMDEFKSITQEDDERCRFYLESANWQLNVALSSFFDTTDGGSMDMPQPARIDQASSDMDVEYHDASAEPAKDDAVAKTKPPSGGSSRLRSLADYAGAAEPDSDEEEGQEFYAGGSEHSGEVIVGPGKKKTGEQIVAKMFKDAKKHGAVPLEESSSSSSQKKKERFFTGGGYKLGETDTDHEFVPAPASADNGEGRKLDVILKLWKNGFTVGDGPLRDYKDPENRGFLQSIMRGEIPSELHKLAKGGEVNLDMEDHKADEYKPEKQKLKAFTGEGHTLGSVTPTVVSSEPRKPEETSSVDPDVLVDESSPVTTLRLQVGDGSRVTQRFNHSHTVGNVYSFVRNRTLDNRHFVLMTTFPNKELAEDATTLKEGNLLNAVIVQRFK